MIVPPKIIIKIIHNLPFFPFFLHISNVLIFFTTERAISSLLRYLFSLLLTASLHVCYCFISLFFLFIVFMFDTNLFVLSIFLNFVTILLFFIRFTKIKIFPSFSILSDRARNIGNHGWVYIWWCIQIRRTDIGRTIKIWWRCCPSLSLLVFSSRVSASICDFLIQLLSDFYYVIDWWVDRWEERNKKYGRER